LSTPSWRIGRVPTQRNFFFSPIAPPSTKKGAYPGRGRSSKLQIVREMLGCVRPGQRFDVLKNVPA
jgi:hypothetical protein